MTKDKWRRLSKKELVELARKKGITGHSSLRKEQLVGALARLAKNVAAKKLDEGKKHSKKKTLHRTRPQLAAAHNNSGGTSVEEQIERSKYDVGVPTRDLSAKIPKDLPGGYGKDRIVCLVRDPYWLHCYWEITRHAIQRAEAALAQDWHGAKPILRLLDVSTTDTTN